MDGHRSPKEYDTFLQAQVPKEQLVVVAVLQSWQPESRGVLKMMEEAWGEWTRTPLPPGKLKVAATAESASAGPGEKLTVR